nr:Unknown Function [uncultured bacterium]
MSKKIFSVFLVALLLISAMGCKKWRNNRETLTSDDHTLAEASFNSILSHVVMATSPLGELLVDSCFTIQKSGSSFPQTITVDFGSEDCPGLFGDEMKGRLVIVLGDSFNHTGAVAAVSIEDLYSKHYKVNGEFTIENLGVNSSGHPEYHLIVENGIITAEEDEAGEDYTISWNCEYHYELIERNNAQIMFDDLYQITGSASGTNQEGRNFTATISEPLTKYLNCRWPGAGTTTIAPDDLKERDLSYGDACEPNSTCCDNIAMEIVKWPDQTVRMK